MKKFSIFVASVLMSMMAMAQAPLWLDATQPMETRIDALVASMTLEEKVSQTIDHSVAIPHLDVPAYEWWNEALHGIARSSRATVFPQAIALGATFDPVLLEDIGTAVSDEGRAIHNEIIRTNKPAIRYQGLTFWSPNVNIFRDPRWGRGQETYGEDPYLSGQLGARFIMGMQGYDPNYLKVAACAKHFVVHSGPEALRHEFDAISSDQDLWETYMPAFKSCVDAGVEAVMCAYNRTNGEACCGSNYLLNEVLIDQWGFDGHILSDCGAIKNFHGRHQLTNTVAESAALALKSGVNLNCGTSYTDGLKAAVEQGLITEAELDNSLKKLLTTRFKLGLFDPVEMNPYSQIPLDVINSPDHKALALEAAEKSIVLLKNDGTLPLSKNSDFIFMSGPLANTNVALLGNYNGLSGDMVTVVEGVARTVSPTTRIQFRQGAMLSEMNKNSMDWYSSNAGRADATIVVLGFSSLLEGEEGESIASPSKGDILNMTLPESQLVLLRKISAKAKASGKKVVTVICAGVPLDLREVNTLSDAVLYAWYPGERGGEAVANILFGDVSPSGKLPLTFPESIEQLPAFDDYSMVDRTYRYATQKPMFPFGFGLSYADFELSEMNLSALKLKKDETLTLKLQVSNKSAIDAEEVLQLYVSFNNDTKHLPLSSLKSFQRVALAANESKTVEFEVEASMFDYYDADGVKQRHNGSASVTVSTSSPGERSQELGCLSLNAELEVK